MSFSGIEVAFPWLGMQKKKQFGQRFPPLPFLFEHLKEHELLSLIIGNCSNSSFYQSKNLSEKILKRFNGFQGLRKSKLDDLLKIEGLSKNKALSILASLELGWRLLHSNFLLGEPYVGSGQVFEAFRSRLGREEVEVVWVLLLDVRLRKVDALEVFRGGLTGALVHPREILRLVLTHEAAAFILLHNHPSGDPEPSRADFMITRKIKAAADLLQIDFLDHIIFAQNAYYSFSDQRQLGGRIG